MQIFADQIRFGIHAGQQNIGYAEYQQLWQRAEALEYDWASCFDHFMPIMTNPEGPCFDGLTMLAAMAASTQRIRCGILVCSVTYRNPAILATIATTIDHASGGRLELGIGAGWYELEHEQYGIPFPPTARRIRMLGTEARILLDLWTKPRTTVRDRYFEVTDAFSNPKPVQQPHIPLWIGGAGEQLTLRVVAQYADGWNTFLGPIETYRHKLDVLAGHCRDVGRDPNDIRKSLVMRMITRRSEAEAQEALRALPGNVAGQQTGIIAGTPEQCAEALLPYRRLGVGDFLLGTRVPYDWETLELVAQEVAPVVRAA